MRRLCLALTTVTVLMTGTAARAATWTTLPSGTAETINAIDYRSPSQYVYVTSLGKLFRNGAQSGGATTGGSPLNGLAMSPDGTIGIAVGTSGKIMRSTDSGATWAALSPVTSYPNTNCAGTAGSASTVTENLTSVSWADATTAYATGLPTAGYQPSPILKTTDGGATWADINRSSSGNCVINNTGELSDVAAIPDSSTVWFIGQDLGERWVSFDGATTATARPASAMNFSTGLPRIAVSAEQQDWLYAVDRVDSGSALNLVRSTDSGASFGAFTHANGNLIVPSLYGVAAVGQTMLAVGNAGAIYLSTDATTVYNISATGARASTNWRDVSMASTSSAAVAGLGGAIIATANASAIPDLIAPTGSIDDPGPTAVAVPQTFTATLTDDIGGSGIDPTSITWSATAPGAGTVTGSGNPTTLTLSLAATWTVRVNFRDLAGNAGTATRTVTVGSTTTPGPPTVLGPPIVSNPPATSAPPTPPKNSNSSTKTTSTNVGNTHISLTVPRKCVKPGKTFKVTLSWKRVKKNKNGKLIKITRADFYVAGARIKIDRKAPYVQRLTVKVGTTSGSTVEVRARAFMKVRKGKQPTKSITNTIRTC